MNPTFLCALALLLPSALAAQEQPPVSQYTKADPALRLVERSDSYEKGTYAVWKGRLTVTGTLVVDLYRAEAGEERPAYGSGAVSFKPDPQSMRRLPQARGYHAQPADDIWVQDLTPVQALAQLVGPRRAHDLASGLIPRFEFSAELSLVEFSTSIECDHRNYALKLERMKLQRPEAIARAEGGNGRC